MENERKTRGSELEVQDHDDSMDLAIAKSTYQEKKLLLIPTLAFTLSSRQRHRSIHHHIPTIHARIDLHAPTSKPATANPVSTI